MNQYIGRMLDDRYEILEVIGTGGMAVVYKARCHRLNRLVAVKILKDEFSGDEEFRRRFRAEGEAVAMLSHPNIVQVYDVSSSGDANYIVMELIDGISLKQYMEVKGVLNWKETLHFSMQIAKALEHAHSRGIVHRDIKPHNVMVLKNGSVKVMDFGIARVMNKSNTLTKEALGSVHYISPEQARGGFTDNRSDLYSLSVVMYEMTTGRPPFDGESPVAVAIQHINGGAPAPSTLNPNIPRGLEQIIVKGMALDVNDRYPNATEMLHDMEEFRKNPAIVFDYHTVLDDETRKMEPIGNIAPRNTAQRVAKARGGTVSTSRPEGTGRLSTQSGTGRIRATGSIPQEEIKNREARLRAQRRKEEQRRKQEKSRAATTAGGLCSLGAGGAIAIFLVAIFNGSLLNQERELVTVPYLVGQTYSENLAAQYPDLTIRLSAQQYDDSFAKGEIMLQEPAGGSQVSKGSELYITVSMGEEPAVKVMEDLVGVTEEEAKAYLAGQGFVPLVRSEASEIFEKGEVIRTDPAKGTVLTKGQTVKLWVSSGAKQVLARMPDVEGLSRENAIQVLNQLGFENVEVTTVKSDKPKDQVVNQSEEKRKDIDVNTEIYLEVSDGSVEETKQTDTTTEPDTIPTEATTQPTTTDGGMVTQTVTFYLPDRTEAFELVILLNGQEILGPTQIQPGSNGYVMELTGSGEKNFDLYINGEYYLTQKVVFG